MVELQIAPQLYRKQPKPTLKEESTQYETTSSNKTAITVDIFLRHQQFRSRVFGGSNPKPRKHKPKKIATISTGVGTSPRSFESANVQTDEMLGTVLMPPTALNHQLHEPIAMNIEHDENEFDDDGDDDDDGEEDTDAEILDMSMQKVDEIPVPPDCTECAICMGPFTQEEIDSIQVLRLKCHNCILHIECLISYLLVQLQDQSNFLLGKYGVYCPARDPMNPSSCQEIFTMTDALELYLFCFHKYPHAFPNCVWTKANVSKFERFSLKGKDYVACPQCYTVHFTPNHLLNTKRPAQVRCQNTVCKHSFCLLCTLPWTRNHNCSTMKQQQAPEPLLDPKATEAMLTDIFIQMTTKPCPNCSARVSHYHGHGCHHIRGCPSCKMHFCYKCGETEEHNLALRGAKSACLCKPSWSTFCLHAAIPQSFAKEPYPHDRRCGCIPCPDCRKKQPCENCNGSCVVCLGLVEPAPTCATWSNALSAGSSNTLNYVIQSATTPAAPYRTTIQTNNQPRAVTNNHATAPVIPLSAAVMLQEQRQAEEATRLIHRYQATRRRLREPATTATTTSTNTSTTTTNTSTTRISNTTGSSSSSLRTSLSKISTTAVIDDGMHCRCTIF
jgi:hypothetical protein